MQQYTAKIIYQIVCGQGDHASQFDEQLILLFAASKHEAIQKALLKGNQEQEAYLNDEGETVKWSFIGIAEINEVKKIEDGVELCSCIKEVEDATSYISMIKFKEETIQQNSALQFS